eukprot:TRINITY_DN31950_c0_g1_i1.p1 TRINITY_DN31950_c0_g1~~TRINITY_DN31950_c0_g1_i1.p1  ORF type:complete len:524 (-),score=114.42 TRINITY_DN31950_c0_g1_i1:51-1511(-)
MSFTCSDLRSERTISTSGANVVDICCVFREGCSQGGTYEFWMALQSMPPVCLAVCVIIFFVVFPNSIIRRLPLIVPGLRVKFQCKRDENCIDAADVWAHDGSLTRSGSSTSFLSNSAKTKKLLSPEEAEHLGYAATGKVVFQFEAYNRILHPEKRILLLCLLFPVLYVLLYIWDKSFIRKVGYTAYPQGACDEGFDCFWSTEDYHLFSWPKYMPLDCQNYNRTSPPENAEFYKCFGVVFSFRQIIGALADSGSILVCIVITLCYKSSAPASMMQTSLDDTEGNESGIKLATNRLQKDIMRQWMGMVTFFVLAVVTIPPGVWAYGRYVNCLESLALLPAIFCFLGFLSLSQLRVNKWLLGKIGKIPPEAVDDLTADSSSSGQGKVAFKRSKTKQALKDVAKVNLEDSETVSRVLEKFLESILASEEDSMPASLKDIIKEVIKDEAEHKKTSIYDFVLSRQHKDLPESSSAPNTEASRDSDTPLLGAP